MKNEDMVAYRLGQMGSKTAPAVPFPIEILDDFTPLEWRVNAKPSGKTSPGSEAQKALGK